MCFQFFFSKILLFLCLKYSEKYCYCNGNNDTKFSSDSIYLLRSTYTGVIFGHDHIILSKKNNVWYAVTKLT